MVMKMKEKAKMKISTKLSLIITIIGLLIIITGTSYAILRGSASSLNEQVIKTGDVTLTLTENYESMNKKIMVLEDSEGLLQEDVYEFNIKNTGSIAARYDLSIINEVPSTYEGEVIPLEYIKVGLEINGEEYGPFNIGELEGIIDSNIIYRKEIINYKLRVWLDKEYEENIESIEGYKAFLKLKVEAEQFLGNLDKSGANEPVLASSMVPVYYDEEEGIWKKADETNTNYKHKWYDYNEKMWANSITYDHTKVIDKSSSNNTGEIIGATYVKEGMDFDGENDYIDAGYENYDFNNQITVAARFKTDEFVTGGSALIDNYRSSTGFEFYVEQTYGRICFQFVYNSSYYVCSDQTELDTWYTAVATYDGSVMKMYLNGKLVNETETDRGLPVSTRPIVLGVNPGYIDTSETRTKFNGIISDALVINEVLTEEEIKNNYSNEINYQENDKTLFYYDLRNYENREPGEEIPMEMISTMQVWVPRYKYKVWNYNADGTKTSKPQEIEIIFEEGIETTGEIECTDTISGTDGAKSESCKINNVECTDSTCNNKYYTHPAFTFGEEEIEGFWIGKFELTGTIDSITTKPNLSSLRSQQVGSFEDNIMKMNDNSNQYGFSTSVDTHMIKNMEWGAVAYLSHSKYGVNKEIGINNNNEYITGCGASAGSSESATCNSYETELGKLASTTGNIYGVYDISGGSSEYIMANMVSPNGTTMISGYSQARNSGYTGIIYDEGKYTSYVGTYSYPEEKYYDKYSFGTLSAQRIRSKLGDAIKEVYITSDYGWYNDTSYLINQNYPWFYRGGLYNEDIHSGLFRSNGNYGYINMNITSRLIITP